MYDELVKRLWECASGECFNCSQHTPTTNASICSKELMKQAADAIEELVCMVADEHNARLDSEERQRWIPVTERLPSEEGFTLIFTAHGHAGVCFFTNGWWGGYEKDGITHWMPLLDSLKEE